MAEKSFIEEELAREARERSGSKLASLFGRHKKILKEPTPSGADRTKKIITSIADDRFGIILTPNGMRVQYYYPTMSDEPQCGQYYTKSNLKEELMLSRARAAQEHSLTELLYTIALNEMPKYIKGE